MQGLGLKGVIVPLLTPMHDDGQINLTVLSRLVDFLIDAGVHGLLTAGTTGEGPLLTTQERQAIAEAVVRHARGRVPVIVQAGMPSTAESIAQVRHAQACGADAAALLCPYFYQLNERALVEHYTTIAASAREYPLYLYNIPQRTGNRIEPAVTVAVTERASNVVGEKDSSGDLDAIRAKYRSGNQMFELLIGSDRLIFDGLELGVRGAVSGNANVIPELFVALFDAYEQSDRTRALALQEQVHVLSAELHHGHDLSLFKGMLDYRGISAGPVRQPLLTAAKDRVVATFNRLAAHGFVLSDRTR